MLHGMHDFFEFFLNVLYIYIYIYIYIYSVVN